MAYSERKFVDQVVGVKGIRPEVVDAALDELQMEGGGRINGFEIEKSDRDRTIIQFVNTSCNQLLEQYDRKRIIDLPDSNIHVLKDGGTEQWTSGRAVEGAWLAKNGAVIIDRKASDIVFAINIFHELFHAKCFTALHLRENVSGPGKVSFFSTLSRLIHSEKSLLKKRLDFFRGGIGVRDAKFGLTLFEDIEEGVQSILDERFYTKYIQPSEIFRSEIETETGWKPFAQRGRERSYTERLITTLAQGVENRGIHKEQIEDLFISAKINGTLKQVGQLVEQILGAGSFKKIAQETAYGDE